MWHEIRVKSEYQSPPWHPQTPTSVVTEGENWLDPRKYLDRPLELALKSCSMQIRGLSLHLWTTEHSQLQTGLTRTLLLTEMDGCLGSPAASAVLPLCQSLLRVGDQASRAGGSRSTRDAAPGSTPLSPPRRPLPGAAGSAASRQRHGAAASGGAGPGGGNPAGRWGVPGPPSRFHSCGMRSVSPPPGTPAHTCTHPEVRSLLCRNGKSKQASGLLCQGDFTGLGQPAPCPELPPVGTLKRTSVVSGRSKPKPTKPESPERGCGESEGWET